MVRKCVICGNEMPEEVYIWNGGKCEQCCEGNAAGASRHTSDPFTVSKVSENDRFSGGIAGGRCGICGNPIDDEVCARNQGLCDLCASGGDDPILSNKGHGAHRGSGVSVPNGEAWMQNIPEGSVGRKLIDIAKKFVGTENGHKFNPAKFENKPISEYILPDFIKSEVLAGEEGGEPSLLLIIEQNAGCFAAFFSMVILLICGFIFTVNIPMLHTNDLYTKIIEGLPLSTELIILGGVVPAIGAFLIVGLIIVVITGCFFNNLYINLKGDCIEYYKGRKFNPQKAKSYSMDNLIATYKKKSKNSGNSNRNRRRNRFDDRRDGGITITFGSNHTSVRSSHYYYLVNICLDNPNASWFQNTFIGPKTIVSLTLDDHNEAMYWKDFLNWYFGSRRLMMRQSEQMNGRLD